MDRPTIREGAEHVIRVLREAKGEPALTVLPEVGDELAAKGKGRRRHTTFTMKEQVRALRDRGLSQMAIADTLNISDARTKKILRELAAAA